MAVIEIGGTIANVILSDDMPTGMPDHIIANPDDSYTILLNARLSTDAQREGFQHAVNHIKNRDYEKDDVQQIEMAAHGLRAESIKCPDTVEVPREWFDRLIQIMMYQSVIIGAQSLIRDARRYPAYPAGEDPYDEDLAMRRLEAGWLYREEGY